MATFLHFCICSPTQAHHLMCVVVWSQEIIFLLCDPAEARIAEGDLVVPLISLCDNQQQTVLKSE